MPRSIVQTAAAYCRKLTVRSRSNFYYAFLFLPPDRRAALEAVYAFCRLVDDVVDEEAPEAVKLAGIARWRHELEQVFAVDGAPTHPVSVELREAVRRFGIRREDMEAVIDGCAMDVTERSYQTFEDLRLYCYRVASAVGLICIEIFGCSTADARAYAVELGLALQLTNILRDVAEDARRGRVYLPADELAAHGVSVADLTAGRRTPEVMRLLRMQGARAREHYVRARSLLGPAERRRLVIAEIMGDIYSELLRRLERSDFDVFGGRKVVSRRRKMAIALHRFTEAKLYAFVERRVTG